MSAPFRILGTAGAARRGQLSTSHGFVETPAFMPVGTLGAVKGVSQPELAALGADILLANLYHLVLRPGVDVIVRLGGLHRFTGWNGPLLTDSGGYQVFSLGHRRVVDADGVTFRSHLDGTPVRFTAESVAAWQAAIGVDFAMVLDECQGPGVSREEAAAAAGRTLAWARRARTAWRGPGALFGIVQGGVHRELREQAAVDLVALGFDGYAIGGVSVGEPLEQRRAVVEWTAPLLPADQPRYLMGVGYPADILAAVQAGIDLFDCVLPSRNARHGSLFTRQGILKIRNARYRDDPRPIDPDCGCPTCARVSRAFLHHLERAGEVTAAVLATVHNLRYYLDFMGALRQAIALGSLTEVADRFAVRSEGEDLPASRDAGANPVSPDPLEQRSS